MALTDHWSRELNRTPGPLGVTEGTIRMPLSIDLTARVVRMVCRGAVTREMPLGYMAPLEVYEYVPVKQTKFSVRYGVRSQPAPDVMLGDDTLASKAERRLSMTERTSCDRCSMSRR